MNTISSDFFDIVNIQSNYFHETRFEVISQNATFKMKFFGFSEIHFDDFSTINQVLLADDLSSIVIIRPLINNHFNHTIINALTRDGFDEELLTEILNTFVVNNLQLAS